LVLGGSQSKMKWMKSAVRLLVGGLECFWQLAWIELCARLDNVPQLDGFWNRIKVCRVIFNVGQLVETSKMVGKRQQTIITLINQSDDDIANHNSFLSTKQSLNCC
jgi:hypothetical protein